MSDKLADALTQELDRRYDDGSDDLTLTGAVAAWLRSPEGREVVARELGLWEGDGVNCCKVSARRMDEAYEDWCNGEKAGQRETALRIAEAIEAFANKYEERPMGVRRHTDTAEGMFQAARIARSMVPEEESNA